EPEDEIAAEDEEEKDERRPRRGELVRSDVDDTAQQGGGRAPASRGIAHVFSLACQAARTSASRAAEIPETAPAANLSRSSWGRVLFQSSVSLMVTARGRKVSPLATARSMFRLLKPAVSPSGGTTIGMSRQARIFCSARNDHGTQVKRASEWVTCLQVFRNSPIGSGCRGPVAL